MGSQTAGQCLVRTRNPARAEKEKAHLTEVLEALIDSASTLLTTIELKQLPVGKDSEFDFPREGIDFYEAKKSFELSLIRQALIRTNGHQANAAKLLNLGTSTLNSIIKRHQRN